MEKHNEDIRKAARDAGIPLWAVAERLGIGEATLSRWLRKPLEDGVRDAALAAIKELAEEVD